MRGIGKRFVYILRSQSDPTHHYVGRTGRRRSTTRMAQHGPCGWTVEHRPWSVVVSVEFPTETEAVRFETVPEVRLRPRICQATFWDRVSHSKKRTTTLLLGGGRFCPQTSADRSIDCGRLVDRSQMVHRSRSRLAPNAQRIPASQLRTFVMCFNNLQRRMNLRVRRQSRLARSPIS